MKPITAEHCTYSRLIENRGRVTCLDPAVVRVAQPGRLPDEQLCERHAPAMCTEPGCERERTAHTPFCSAHVVTNPTSQYLTPKENTMTSENTFNPLQWDFRPANWDAKTCREMAHCFKNSTVAENAKSAEGTCYATLADHDDPQKCTKLNVIRARLKDSSGRERTYILLVASEFEAERPRVYTNPRTKEQTVTGVWVDRVVAWYYPLTGATADEAIAKGVRLIESIEASFRNFSADDDLQSFDDDAEATDELVAAGIQSFDGEPEED